MNDLPQCTLTGDALRTIGPRDGVHVHAEFAQAVATVCDASRPWVVVEVLTIGRSDDDLLTSAVDEFEQAAADLAGDAVEVADAVDAWQADRGFLADIDDVLDAWDQTHRIPDG